MSRALLWSYGGGTQSVAIAVLVARGDLPTPKLAIIADTKREKSTTWEYTEQYIRPLLEGVGVELCIAKHELATVDLYRGSKLLIPAFGPGGDTKLPTWCSNEWKKRVVMRYLRLRGYGPKRPVDLWMGFSTDEVSRAKPSGVGWIEYKWPLLFDRPTTRQECKRLVGHAGLPSPPRSSCWMCPFMGNMEWRELRAHAPDDFQRAVVLDDALRQRDDVYVHRSGVPLAEADLDREGAMDTSHECQTGFCFV